MVGSKLNYRFALEISYNFFSQRHFDERGEGRTVPCFKGL